jgi:magnesium-transporting ATPase (P-type)
MGTHVVSGSASAVVVVTGPATIFGSLAHELERRAPESEFERGSVASATCCSKSRLRWFFAPLRPALLVAVLAITVLLALAAEAAKHVFDAKSTRE